MNSRKESSITAGLTLASLIMLPVAHVDERDQV